MRAIAVDDEKFGLSRITRLLIESEYLSYVKGYSDVKQAIENFETDNADIAFLDIEMPEMSGLILAEILMEKKPGIEVVFVTAYDKYAVQAFEINAIGYLLKPVELKNINNKIENILVRRNAYQNTNYSELLYIQAFEHFLVSKDKNMNNFVKFRTEKSKELLGYLLSFNGKPVSKDKIIDVLWPDMEIERAVKNLHTTCYYIRKNLGLENLIIRNQNGYSINKKYVISDLHIICLAIEELGKKTPNVEIIYDAFFKYSGVYFENEDYLWALDQQGYYEEYFEKMGIFLFKYYQSKERRDVSENILNHILKINSLSELAYLRLIEINIKKNNIANAKKIYNMFIKNSDGDINKETLNKMNSLFEMKK
jgi:two-component SAPR family response regulator